MKSFGDGPFNLINQFLTIAFPKYVKNYIAVIYNDML